LKMIKPRQKRCKFCREKFTPFNTLAQACSIPCAIGLAKKKALKVQKEAFKAKDVKTLRKKAQDIFNKYIRIRDVEDGCISCDKHNEWDGQWHAGHYMTVGANPELRFNEDNCHKQCSVCNNHLSGNLSNYRKRLEKKIGLERLEALEVKGNPIRLRAEDYQKVIETYRAKIKQLGK